MTGSGPSDVTSSLALQLTWARTTSITIRPMFFARIVSVSLGGASGAAGVCRNSRV